MQEWLRAQMANGFSGFSGTSITASVRLNQSVLNDLLAAALKDAASSAERMDRGADTVGIAGLVRLIASSELRVVDGAVVMNLEIRV